MVLEVVVPEWLLRAETVPDQLMASRLARELFGEPAAGGDVMSKRLVVVVDGAR